MTTVRFAVLGPLLVQDDEGRPVKIVEVKVRALLADLLVHDGRPVPTDRLIEDIWHGRPPGNPANALQAKVSQLRRALGRERVAYQPPGYLLRLAPEDDVDARRFLALVAQARTAAPETRAALLTEALRLWRGAAYADFADEEFTRAAAHRLTEQRLAVVEEQAEMRLAAGDHLLLTGELADLVARHPLRERLRAIQLRALYLAGRQSEALASYAELRRRLADELGVDPGPELSALHQAILRQDPSLGHGPGPERAALPEPAHGALPQLARDVVPQPERAALRQPARGALRRPEQAALPQPERAAPRQRERTVLRRPEEAGLHQAISHRDPSRGAPRTNLPTQLTALIGRRHALEEITALLGGSRLVTLIGPGGVGKTRVAVETAARLAAPAATAHDWGAQEPATQTPAATVPGFPDGVWLIELADHHGSTDDLVQVIATVLGITGAPISGAPANPTDRLATALRERRTLLVLDNCEHLIEQTAELANLLLRAAPTLSILATSREPLGLTGETLYPIDPLQQADAIRLFTERATASAPNFAPGPSTLETVADICRRLDGIPLALELAATRVRSLGVKELAARLENRFRLLTTGRRGAPARQQTLRAVIDWSWNLLTHQEQVVLRRLAVPAGGCTLDAAEAVCAGPDVPADEVLDLVTRLVDRSLVVMTETPAGPRYRLLESIAAYAMERLRETEDLTALRERHLHHYLALAEQADPHLRGPDQQAWLDRLDAEAANFRAALHPTTQPHATTSHPDAPPPSDAIARLATALTWWWLLRGRLTEGRQALSAALAQAPHSAELRLLQGAFALLTGDRSGPRPAPSPGTDADPARHGRMLWLYAYGLFHAGLPDVSEQVNAQAQRLLAADAWGTAAVLALRAMNALSRGDLDSVARNALHGATLFHELGDRWGELQTTSPLSTLAEIKGDYAEATHRQSEGLHLAQELGLTAEVAARRSGLGRLALLSHDWERARDLHEQARRLAAEQGYVYGQVHAIMGLALGSRRSGDLDAAAAYLAQLRDDFDSSPAGEHLLHVELGFTAELRGDAARAAALQLHGLEVACSIGEPRAVALSLEGSAGAALAGGAGRAEIATLLLGAADAARRSVGAPLPAAERGDVDRITSATRAVLGEAAHAEAFLRGTKLTWQEAAALARATLA
ncbi:AfsR/SARP family transcriptional regulator [[Actinomadura] parvosata]|uniref:AfsR/SARP family transcriptional regulator n=1 Tax=[Actinomadura] parvosata TaxID=1955412 RepID=UPI00406CC7AE